MGPSGQPVLRYLPWQACGRQPPTHCHASPPPPPPQTIHTPPFSLCAQLSAGLTNLRLGVGAYRDWSYDAWGFMNIAVGGG